MNDLGENFGHVGGNLQDFELFVDSFHLFMELRDVGYHNIEVVGP